MREGVPRQEQWPAIDRLAQVEAGLPRTSRRDIQKTWSVFHTQVISGLIMAVVNLALSIFLVRRSGD